MEILKGIATGAPIWIWPLLVGLVGLGLLSTRQRDVSRYIFFGLPFMALITLNNLANLPKPQVVWPFVVLGFTVGAGVAYVAQARWLLGRTGNRILLAGEWLTFSVIMVMFWSNFIGGMMQAIAPKTYESALFLGVFAMVISAASGSFTGRSLRALRFQG